MTSPFNDNAFPLDVSKLAQTLAGGMPVCAPTEVEPRYPIRRILVGCCAPKLEGKRQRTTGQAQS
jgi:hypothetical protein